MAQRTLLQIINQVQREYALPVSVTIIDNADLTTSQMLAFAQAELEELGRKHNWTALTFENNLVVIPPVSTTSDTVENSAIIINIPDTSALVANFWAVTGENIPVGSRILSVDSPTQITMTMRATGTKVNAAVVFAKDMYPEPSDFDHFINQTWWDRTNRWQLLGPLSPQVDQWHLSGVVATGPRRYFRQIGPFGNTYRIWPPPAEISNLLQLVFEYQTVNRIRASGSLTSFIQYWANDLDVPLLDDRLIIAGIKWRFWEQKGFNWLSKRDEYDKMVARQWARDGGAPTLSLAPQRTSNLITTDNVQDGFFPGPTGPNMG